ncbi:hypothetical protein D3C85_1354230 [compost metagenome]
MLIEMPLDLVAAVRRLRGRVCARSKAYLRIRSTPRRVNTDSCSTSSCSLPSNILPPTEEYSPSVFSRITTKSISPGSRPASGQGTPGNKRTGRIFTYWSKSRRNLSSEPHREIWSGTLSGQPTAPK